MARQRKEQIVSDKITKTVQVAIEKLEAKIASLEQELKTAKADLVLKQQILKLATNGHGEGRQ